MVGGLIHPVTIGYTPSLENIIHPSLIVILSSKSRRVSKMTQIIKFC